MGGGGGSGGPGEGGALRVGPRNWKAHLFARMVECLLSYRRDLARHAGANGHLPCGAAPGGQHAQCPTGCDGRDVAVVAGGRALWSLRSPRALQRRLWRVVLRERVYYFDSAFLRGYFL